VAVANRRNISPLNVATYIVQMYYYVTTKTRGDKSYLATDVCTTLEDAQHWGKHLSQVHAEDAFVSLSVLDHDKEVLIETY